MENKPAKTSFTANANQSNESITPARVAGTEIARVTGKKKIDFTTVENWFLPPLKLVFVTVEIELTGGERFLPPWKI